MRVRTLALVPLTLAACSESITGPPPPPSEPAGPQLVMVKGRVGTFVYHHAPGVTYLAASSPWNNRCNGYCPNRRWVDNVFDGMRPELDSLARLYPASRCVLRTQDAPEVVDCLRLPVHVGDQVVYTDSLGWFTAGPFLEGDSIKVWIDHDKLPLFQKDPTARVNCTRPPNYYSGNQCRISTLFNWGLRWKWSDTPDDGATTIVAGETNLSARKQCCGRTPTYDYVVVPAWPMRSFAVRLPAGAGARMRLWGVPATQRDTARLVYELRANWNGELIFRGDTGHLAAGMAQFSNPWPESDELCVDLDMTPNSGQGIRYVDYSDEKIVPDLGPRSNCRTHIPNYAGTSNWLPPPLPKGTP